MNYKSLAYRLAGLESKARKALMPLVLFYRESEGLSAKQQSRISDAKGEGRSIKLIRTTVLQGINAAMLLVSIPVISLVRILLSGSNLT